MVVFLSLAFNQLFWLLWCHISSSVPSHLFSSIFTTWIDSKSAIHGFKFLELYSEGPLSAYPHGRRCAYSMTLMTFGTPPSMLLMAISRSCFALFPMLPLLHLYTVHPQATWIQSKTVLIIAAAIGDT